MVAVPLFPSLVAVIVAEPAPRPVTSPLPLTRAIVVSPLAQVTTLPDSGLPFASLGVALSCTVCPTGTLADAGVTVTEATGTGTLVTVMVAVPLFPSLAAVIVAEPAPRPVTSPLPLTRAIVVSSLAQVTTLPDSGLPFASLGVALSCTVCPTGTLATIMVAVPLCPSLVAVIVAEPAPRPVTSPLPLTRAIVVSSLAQVTTLPDSGLPFASLGVALSCTVCPTGTLADDGVTVTEATGTGALVTVMVAVPLFPSLVAVIVAVPAPFAVTNPVRLTVATVVSLDDHVTARPESGLPLASLGVAVSCTVCPTWPLADDGVTVTEATGTLVTVIAAVPLFPSLIAVIVAEPAAFPVTRPLPLTFAIVVSLDAHVTVRPESGLPLSSLGVALSCTVRPTGTLAVAGLTVTVATAARQEMVICAVSDRFPGWLVAASV